MIFRREKLPPALKHAAYSATSILPGKSLAEFEKLHQSLIADISPAGPLEEDIVATMTRLLWRKQHFNTLRIAAVARRRGNEIDSKSTDNLVEAKFGHLAEINPAVRKAAVHAAQRQKEEELGEAYALVPRYTMRPITNANALKAVEKSCVNDGCIRPDQTTVSIRTILVP